MELREVILWTVALTQIRSYFPRTLAKQTSIKNYHDYYVLLLENLPGLRSHGDPTTSKKYTARHTERSAIVSIVIERSGVALIAETSTVGFMSFLRR